MPVVAVVAVVACTEIQPWPQFFWVPAVAAVVTPKRQLVMDVMAATAAALF